MLHIIKGIESTQH